MSDRLTGKASYFIFSGTPIPITKCTQKVTRKDADTTDNGDYNQSNDLIYPTQLIVSAATEFAIEGRYRKSTVPTILSQAVFESNPGGLFARLGLDSGTVSGSGYFDITEFNVEDPVEDTITYSGTMKSNGQFTPGS
jgi:hypothetical protein